MLILGNSISVHSFINDVGTGSRQQKFGEVDKINVLIYSLLRGWKEVSGVTSTVLSYTPLLIELSFWICDNILFECGYINLVQRSVRFCGLCDLKC